MKISPKILVIALLFFLRQHFSVNDIIAFYSKLKQLQFLLNYWTDYCLSMNPLPLHCLKAIKLFF